MNTGTDQMSLCLIQCAPPSEQNGFKITKLFYEWSANMDRLPTSPQEKIITGDLNIYFYDRSDATICRFTEHLDARGLV